MILSYAETQVIRNKLYAIMMELMQADCSQSDFLHQFEVHATAYLNNVGFYFAKFQLVLEAGELGGYVFISRKTPLPGECLDCTAVFLGMQRKSTL